MAPTTQPALVGYPLGKWMRVYLAHVPDGILNRYVAALSLCLPTLEQRGEMAAIAHWRASDYDALNAHDLFVLLCRLESVDPDIAISTDNASELNPILIAQKTIWERLDNLVGGKQPKTTPIPGCDIQDTDEWNDFWADDVPLWLQSCFTLLGKFEEVEGFDASGIRRQLPPRVRETLTRQAARELLDTPFLLGHTLYQNVNRFADGALVTRRIASVLAIATLNALRVEQLTPEHQDDLAFWHHVLKGFMYGAVDSNRNTLAEELNGDIHLQAMLHEALDSMPANSTPWKTWTRGPSRELNTKIAKLTASELWAAFEAQQSALR